MRRPARTAAAAVGVALTAAVALALGGAAPAAAQPDGLVANLGGEYTRTAGAPAACPPTVVHSASRAGLQSGVYYIDHANITANGTACAVGGRATLFEPALLANASAITDLEASARNDAVALLSAPVAAAIMGALRAAGGNEWLGGYEEQERVCGGYRWPAAITFLLYSDGVTAAEAGFSTDEGGMVVILPGNATCVYAIDDADREGVPQLPAVGTTAAPEEPAETGEPDGEGPLPTPSPSAAPTPTASAAPDNDGAACFPADAAVDTPHGPVRVDALAVGDEVAAPGGRTTTVFLFTHASPPDAARPHVYVELSAADGRTLTVTPSHYVYVGGGRRVPAGTVAVGDTLDDNTAGRCVPVVGVRRVLAPRGLYNPQTLDGDLVVSGFRVSTYTTAIEPATAHGLLAPVRGMWRLAAGLAGLVSA